MKSLYGEFTQTQIKTFKKSIQGSIFFLLLCVDPKTKNQYENIDVNKSFESLQLLLNGANELLLYQPELIKVMALLEAAHLEYNNQQFNFQKYRKLILDAGAEVLRMKEGD